MDSGTVADGKYRALIELGQGGSAIVRLGVAQGPVGFSRLVVLKSMKKELAKDPDFRAMFLNEARLSARLNHPNVVQVTEVVSDVGSPVIVMEYLEGKSLSEVRSRARGILGTDAILRIIAESLLGLHYSHELKDFDGAALGVVHRDMTPQNLFITYDGQVKVLDFGIAKLSGSLVETETGVIKGKLRYMPPEQIAGEHVDRRVDVFAVGVMLWEAACGRKMWQDYSEAAVMNAILRGDLPSPREFDPDVPPELEAIVMKALEHEREDRYPTAEALREALEAYLATRPPVSLREVGRTVSQHFAQERDETRRLIDSQLKAASFSNDSGKYVFGSVPPAPREVSDRHTPMTATTTTPSRSSRRGLLAGVAALAVLGLFGAQRIGNSGGTAAASALTVTVTPPVAPAPAKDSDIPPPPALQASKIDVRVTPSSAVITLDGKPLSNNPYHAEFVPDGALHQLRAEAEGYVTRELDVNFDKDVNLELALEPNRAAAHGSRRGGIASAPKAKAKTGAVSAPSAASDAAPKPACSPPYFVDSEGLKRYKPECL
jgi:eukaryotic-like serine/threonine-protein kinase